MTKDYSPFTPGLPVPVEFFVGRQAEISRLREKVAGSTTGRLQVGFLSGERGIGKSSVASFVKFLVERDFKVLGLHTFLGGVTALEEMARRIFDRLLKESVERTWFDKVKEFFGNHIRQVGLFGVGVELGISQKDLQRAVHDFAPALRRLMEQLGDERKGILLILDDINGLASSPDFANWMKSLVDEIATSEKPLPLCLLLVGLEERRQSLISLNPSLARVFDLIDLPVWKDAETRGFFQNTFAKAGVVVKEDVLGTLCRYTGGLPVLAHEIGDAVFRVDKDGCIDASDLSHGVINAAEIVARKHFESQAFRAIRSSRYHSVFANLLEILPDEFKRGEVRAKLHKDDRQAFDSFLRQMTRLGVIVRVPEKSPGAYRFRNQLYRMCFRLEALSIVQSGNA